MILELRRQRQRLGERRSCRRRKKEVTGQVNIASGHPLDKPCSSKVKSHRTRNVSAQGESPDGEGTKQTRLDPGTWGTDSKRSVLPSAKSRTQGGAAGHLHKGIMSSHWAGFGDPAAGSPQAHLGRMGQFVRPSRGGTGRGTSRHGHPVSDTLISVAG